MCSFITLPAKTKLHRRVPTPKYTLTLPLLPHTPTQFRWANIA